MDIRIVLVHFLAFSIAFLIAWAHRFFFGLQRAMLAFSVCFVFFEYLAVRPYLKRGD